MSTAFVELWGLSSFRRSLRGMQQVADEHRSVLEQAASTDSGGDAALDSAGDENPEIKSAITVVQTLRQVRDFEGREALLEDVERLAEPVVPGIAALVGDLLQEEPAEELRHRIRKIERSGLPVAISARIQVDFRAASPGVETQPIGLVPVYVVRIELDEPVGGSSALVFQVSPDRADEFAGVIAEAREVRDAVVKTLPNDIVLQRPPEG